MHGQTPVSEDTTPNARIRLRVDVFERLAASKGATTKADQVRLTGVPRRSLYRIQLGHPPSIDNAMRICKALGVPFDVLFEHTEAA